MSDARKQYYIEALQEAGSEMGLDMTDEQAEELAAAYRCAMSMESEAFGDSVASSNRAAELKREGQEEKKKAAELAERCNLLEYALARAKGIDHRAIRYAPNGRPMIYGRVL